MSELSHLDDSGAARMVDVGGKPETERLARAEARVRMAPHIEALRHELERVLDEALDGSRQVLRVDASHDLLLPRLQALAIAQQRLHLELRFAGSLDALGRSKAQPSASTELARQDLHHVLNRVHVILARRCGRLQS